MDTLRREGEDEMNRPHHICRQHAVCVFYIVEDLESIEEGERLQQLIDAETFSSSTHIRDINTHIDVGSVLLTRSQLYSLESGPDNVVATVSLSTKDPFLIPQISHYNLIDQNESATNVDHIP